jgi:hypothetical protein
MNKPSEQKNTATSEQLNKQREAGELADQELDIVAGGAGTKATTGGTKTTEDQPKETVTFEYR